MATIAIWSLWTDSPDYRGTHEAIPTIDFEKQPRVVFALSSQLPSCFFDPCMTRVVFHEADDFYIVLSSSSTSCLSQPKGVERHSIPKL